MPDEGSRSTFAQPLPKTFHDVLWADLQYSGVLDLVSPSFYPLQVPTQPSELKAQDWSAAPANAYMVAYGNLSLSGTNLSFAGFLSDVRNPTAPLALQKVYTGAATDEGARTLAHQFANDIVAVLSGGQPGIALTQDHLRELAIGQQGNLGDGLRWRKCAPIDALENHRADSALVAGCRTHRVHVLCSGSRSDVGADLHLLAGIEPHDFLPAIPRNQ